MIHCFYLSGCFFSVTRWLWWTTEVSWDLKRFSRENSWWLPFYRHYGNVSILQFVDKMSFTWLLETNIQIRCSLFKHTTYIKEIYTVSQKKIQQAPTITDNFWQTASAYFLKSCGCPTFLVPCALCVCIYIYIYIYMSWLFLTVTVKKCLYQSTEIKDIAKMKVAFLVHSGVVVTYYYDDPWWPVLLPPALCICIF